MIISELMTGRVMKTFEFPSVIQEIRWNPSTLYSDVIAVTSETSVYFIDTDLSGNAEIHQHSQDLLHSVRKVNDRAECRGVEWLVNDGSEVFIDSSNVVVLRHTNPVRDIAWHHKGDYFCVNASDASSSIVYIHQLSKGQSQIPITKLKGIVQRVLFSPSSHPYLFVATQTEVKIYNLVKQTLVNKLRTGVKWVSSMAVRAVAGVKSRFTHAATIWWWEASMPDSLGSTWTWLPLPTRRCATTRRRFDRSSSILSIR